MTACQTETLTIAGHPALHGQFWCLPGGEKRPGVLLCHGFASCLLEWGDFPQRLAEAGYAVLAFDFSGHGRSDGARTYITADSHLGDTLRALAALLARPELDGRFAVIGHSLGTAAVMRTLGTPEGRQAAAAVLYAPPNRIRQELGLGEWLAYAAASRIAKPVLAATGQHLFIPYRIQEESIFVDQAAAARAKAQGFLQKRITLNNYDYMVEQQDNALAAADVTTPVRIVVGGKDKAIANHHSRQVFDALRGEKSWIAIPDGGHSLLGDHCSAVAADAGLTWLLDHLPITATISTAMAEETAADGTAEAATPAEN